MTSLVLAWLVFNALAAALLLSQARQLVLALAGFALMAWWFAWAGAFWFALSPLWAGRACLRRFRPVVAR